MDKALFNRLKERLAERQTVLVATVLSGPHQGQQGPRGPRGQALLDAGGRILAGGFDSEDLTEAVARAASGYFADLRSGRQKISVGGTVADVFFEIHPPPSRVIVIGAVHVAIHLCAFAKRMGLQTTVIDPRTAFATKERFADADQLILEWPAEALADLSLTENTFFAMLSHDLKIDLPALEAALRSPARYIGALGSKKTHLKRVAALRDAGFADDDIARVRNPIGLDLGGRKAEEIALSIISEMVAVGHGRS